MSSYLIDTTSEVFFYIIETTSEVLRYIIDYIAPIFFPLIESTSVVIVYITEITYDVSHSIILNSRHSSMEESITDALLYII